MDQSFRRDRGSGKFVFVWADGEPLFDSTGTHSVLTTVLEHKGQYYHDPTGQEGTLLYSVKQDRETTGSQLSAYALDGAQQCQAAELVQKVQTSAQRLRRGAWQITVSWQSKAGSGHAERLELV